MQFSTLIAALFVGLIAPGVIADVYCDRYAKPGACLKHCKDNGVQFGTRACVNGRCQRSCPEDEGGSAGDCGREGGLGKGKVEEVHRLLSFHGLPVLWRALENYCF
ncbi:unnamed protein product [Zymoseptoria tritici ST99CH_3D1]|nr:unnamed protein product [Zymoseptoria tritici ST99CH_3D1]